MKLSEKVEQFLDRGEDYPTEPVPREAKKSWWSIGIVWIGVYICIPCIIEGLLLIGGLPLWEAVIADILGISLFLFFMLFQSNIGAQTGLSTYVAARETFGFAGSHIVSIIAAVGSLGWFAIQSRAFGESLVALFGLGNIAIISLIGGFSMMLTAIFGYRGIEALSYPTVVYIFIVMIYMAIKSAVFSPLSFSEAVSRTPLAEPMNFTSAVSMVVGGMAVGVAVSLDVGRFAKSFRDLGKALYFLVLPVGMIQPVASIFIGMYMNSTELGEAMVMAGGFLGFLLVLLGAWTSNDNNLYGASLAVAELLPKVKRWKIALFLGIAASIVSAMINLGQYANIMYVFNALCIPVTGVMCADFYLLPKFGIKKEKKKLCGVAIAAIFIGGASEILFDFNIVMGTFVPPPIIAIVLAGAVYIFAMLTIDKIKLNKTG